MKNFITVLFLLISIIACESNSAQSQTQSQTLNSLDYQKKMNELGSVQLIDVRTPAEFVEEHLIDATNIDYNNPDFSKNIDKLDKTKPTFIYCLSGGRSGSAMKILKEKGFKEVYNLKGGIMQWKGDNLKVTAATDAAAWKGMTKDEYINLIPDNMDMIVDFKAAWCAPCKQLKPILESLEKEYSGKLKVLAIDVDENKSLADDMRIAGIPYLIFYKNGKQQKVLTGAQTKKDIIKQFGLIK